MPGASTGTRNVLMAALAGAAAATLLPDRLGLGHRVPFVDAVAFRPQAALGALAATAFLAGPRRSRPVAAALGPVAVAGLAAAVAARAGQRRPRDPAEPTPGRAGTTIAILSSNVLRGWADPDELTALIERDAPDFVVLPESGPEFRDRLMAPLAGLGYRSWVSTGPGGSDLHSVTLLAGPRAGALRVRVGNGMRLPHLEATGGLLGARTLYAVHAAAPVGRRRTAHWRRDLAALQTWCAGPIAPIVVGDLNATLDHRALRAALGGCRSAAGPGPRGLIGTYPARLPRWLGIQIDHVLVPAAAVVTRFEVTDLRGSDHRAVSATVRITDGALCARPGQVTLNITL